MNVLVHVWYVTLAKQLPLYTCTGSSVVLVTGLSILVFSIHGTSFSFSYSYLASQKEVLVLVLVGHFRFSFSFDYSYL